MGARGGRSRAMCALSLEKGSEWELAEFIRGRLLWLR